MKPPTKLETAFTVAICDQHQPQQQCGCGILHFSQGVEPDKLLQLRSAAAERPGDLAEHDTDTLACGEFAGTVLVAGCRCDTAAKWGNFLWAHRHPAARFLRNMTEALATDSGTLLRVLPREIGGGE